MFTKTPKVFKNGKHAPSVTPVKGKTGLQILKQSAGNVSSKVSTLTGKKSKIGYKNL